MCSAEPVSMRVFTSFGIQDVEKKGDGGETAGWTDLRSSFHLNKKLDLVTKKRYRSTADNLPSGSVINT